MRDKIFFGIIFVCVTVICYKLFFEVQAMREGIGGEAILLFLPAVVGILKLRKTRKDD